MQPQSSLQAYCRDNALAESIFSNLKKEHIGEHIYKTRELAKAVIFDYIELFYNRTYRQGNLGGRSPR
jgi:putative transposase